MTVPGVGGRPRLEQLPKPKLPREPLPTIVDKDALKPKDPWEQQEGESNKAFRGFKTYLELGPTRTYRATAEKCERALEVVKNWATLWLWPERAEAWDRHLFRAEMMEYETRRRECARENALIIKDAKELLVHDIKAYLEKAKAQTDPTKPVLSPGQFTNLLEAVITLERMNNELLTNLPESAIHKPKEVIHKIVYAKQTDDGEIVDDPDKTNPKGVVLDATYTVKESEEPDAATDN